MPYLHFDNGDSKQHTEDPKPRREGSAAQWIIL